MPASSEENTDDHLGDHRLESSLTSELDVGLGRGVRSEGNPLHPCYLKTEHTRLSWVVWKAAAPRQRLIFWDPAVNATEDRLGPQGLRDTGADAQEQGAAHSTALRSSPPPPPRHTGGQRVAVNFWLSPSCNKAGNCNCHSRQRWLAKEKPTFTFKSLVASKTGTPSK